MPAPAARPLTWLDVFSSRPLEGNPLAVVHEADGLGEEEQLGFARETNLSETTFVQTARAAGADYRNRIWDPQEELPFAGHPSLGTAVADAGRRGLEQGTLRQETPAGVQPVDVERRDERRWCASMRQEPPVFGAEVEPEVALGCAGLAAQDGVRELPPQFVSTGVAQLLVPVAAEDALARARPDWPVLRPLLEEARALVLYLVHVEGERVRARAFFPVGSGGEDPATGSAAGPLVAYLAARAGLEAIRVEQGVEMGRPSVLDARVEDDRVRVGGEVVVLAEGRVWL